jgi:hypothetical protein
VGIDQQITPKFHLMASVRSNYSTFESHDEVYGDQLNFTSWDLYHLTIGATVGRAKSDLSVGFNYGFGSDNNFMQSVNFSNASEANFLLGDTAPVVANFRSLGLLFGYTYYLQ